METLWQDIRYAVRLLIKRPGFTIVAVLTLALGIGANTAIFTAVDRALLRPLPYKNSDTLVHLWETSPQRDYRDHQASYPDYLDWREQNNAFEEMAGYSGGSVTFTGRGEPEQIQVARVTSSFFPLLGVDAIAGRTFRAEEDTSSTERVVMLSHGLWQRRFGADSQIIGQQVTLNGAGFTVVGVLPQGFHFAKVGAAEMWFPLRPQPFQAQRRNMYWLNVIARLKPNVSEQQAYSEMSAIAGRIEEQFPDSHAGIGIKIVPLRDEIVGPVKPLLLVLLGAVAFVLLISCANVANLLLARASGRRREIAIRLALGSSRLRLIRQLLTESMLLALAGGVAGLLLAGWGIELLMAAIPNSLIVQMPYLEGMSLDVKMLGFTFALSLLTGIIFGLAPAYQSSKPDLNEALKEGSKSSTGIRRARLRSLLVVSEIALALVLLIGAGLMIKSLNRLLAVNPGFDTENLLTFGLSLPMNRYSETDRVVAIQDQLLARIESLPGVKGAATTDLLPLSGGGNTGTLQIEGQPVPPPDERTEFNIRTISPNYFSVMGIPLVKGRFFTERDNNDRPRMLVINQTMADRVFPDGNALGRRVMFTFDRMKRPWEIIGIVGDENVTSLDVKITPIVYSSYLQDSSSQFNVVVRTTTDPSTLISAVRSEVRALDSDLPVSAETTMEQLISNSPSTFLRRYPAFLIGAFAIASLCLAMLGIYGVISYSVSERTHEIGIRMALGAGRKDVLKLVVGQSMLLAGVGIALGIVGALALTRIMASLLYGVSATDPQTFIVTSLVLTGVALGACFVPARRATKVDPMVALRYE
ncbi:MAG TPA: ABC transporter permease [Blastocatellia bacterium]|nr:ABC transporter permease [Blastocatellia bacterium]